MSKTNQKEFLLILLKYSDINVASHKVYDDRLGIDQFKQFLRKELIEK